MPLCIFILIISCPFPAQLIVKFAFKLNYKLNANKLDYPGDVMGSSELNYMCIFVLILCVIARVSDGRRLTGYNPAGNPTGPVFKLIKSAGRVGSVFHLRVTPLNRIFGE